MKKNIFFVFLWWNGGDRKIQKNLWEILIQGTIYIIKTHTQETRRIYRERF